MMARRYTYEIEALGSVLHGEQIRITAVDQETALRWAMENLSWMGGPAHAHLTLVADAPVEPAIDHQ